MALEIGKLALVVSVCMYNDLQSCRLCVYVCVCVQYGSFSLVST